MWNSTKSSINFDEQLNPNPFASPLAIPMSSFCVKAGKLMIWNLDKNFVPKSCLL